MNKNEVLTPEEKTLLPEIVKEAARYNMVGQAMILGWLIGRRDAYIDQKGA